MSILNSLTIKNLKLNKKRTIVTIIGIILSTALMVGIGLLFSSFQDALIQEVISSNGSYHAMYEDITFDKIDSLKERGDLTYFYESKIGFSKIDSVNEYKPYLYIAGVNKNYFGELKLKDGRFPNNDSEIVISEHIKTNGGVTYNIGDTLNLEYGNRYIIDDEIIKNGSYEEGESLKIIGTKEYTVVGIVERSGYESYSACGYSVFTLDEKPTGSANLYITFNKKSRIISNTQKLADTLNYDKNLIDYNSSLLALYGESNYSNIGSSMVGMMIIMLSLVSIGCIIVIYNSFAISVMERKKEFGLLSSIGTKKKQLSYMVFFEALIVGVIGIVLGIAGAYLGIGTVIIIINKLIGGILTSELRLVTNGLFIIIPVIFMIIVILISAIIPSKRASKVSPIEAIRQNNDIKINKKKIKTNKLITKVFGIEGEIALKNIKRNKKKYRITIVSLFISIVLFISFSAYTDYTLNTASDVVGEYPYNITVYYYDYSSDLENKVNNIVNSPDVKDYVKYSVKSIPFKKNVTYTDDFIKYSKERFMDSYDEMFEKEKIDFINVVTLDDNNYAKYKKELGLNEDKVILFNKMRGVTYYEGKRTNYNISVIKDTNINLISCNLPLDADENKIDSYCTNNLDNIFITEKDYYLAPELSKNSNYSIIVNEKLFKKIFNSEPDGKVVNIVSDNYKNIDVLGADINKNNSEGAYYSNLTEETKMSNNIVLVIKILMYGFISLVTLIGVTSVFNTISTSMALRKKEFAILRSIGLTRKGFNKILFFESLFFGLKSLLYSLPVSFGVIILIHKSLSNMIENSNLLIPWNSVIITIASVFIIVLATMIYSTSKIKKQNILEQIREENI